MIFFLRLSTNLSTSLGDKILLNLTPNRRLDSLNIKSAPNPQWFYQLPTQVISLRSISTANSAENIDVQLS